MLNMPRWQSYVKRLVVYPSIIINLQFLSMVKNAYVTLRSMVTRLHLPMIVRTPEERFRGLDGVGYSFQPNYVDLHIGGGKTLPRIHYLDEGPPSASETILCLHGEPSWSFLYRKMIPGFVAAGYRVIAPDFIGFGKSDKYTHMESYTHDLHTMSLRLLIDHLELSNVTLVCQDWGGLIGLSVVKDIPHIFSRLVVMNTGLPDGTDVSANPIQILMRVVPFLLWRSFAQLLGTSLPVWHLFSKSIMDPRDDVLDGYNAPFPSSLYKAGAAKWPLLVPVSSNTPVAVDMRTTKNFLSDRWSKPILVMFSDRDPITRGAEASFLKMMPHAKSVKIIGAGHFLQEDKGLELAENIIKFMTNEM